MCNVGLDIDDQEDKTNKANNTVAFDNNISVNLAPDLKANVTLTCNKNVNETTVESCVMSHSNNNDDAQSNDENVQHTLPVVLTPTKKLVENVNVSSENSLKEVTNILPNNLTMKISNNVGVIKEAEICARSISQSSKGQDIEFTISNFMDEEGAITESHSVNLAPDLTANVTVTCDKNNEAMVEYCVKSYSNNDDAQSNDENVQHTLPVVLTPTKNLAENVNDCATQVAVSSENSLKEVTNILPNNLTMKISNNVGVIKEAEICARSISQSSKGQDIEFTISNFMDEEGAITESHSVNLAPDLTANVTVTCDKNNNEAMVESCVKSYSNNDDAQSNDENVQHTLPVVLTPTKNLVENVNDCATQVAASSENSLKEVTNILPNDATMKSSNNVSVIKNAEICDSSSSQSSNDQDMGFPISKHVESAFENVNIARRSKRKVVNKKIGRNMEMDILDDSGMDEVEYFEEESPEYIPPDCSESDSSVDETQDCVNYFLRDGNSLLDNNDMDLVLPELWNESVVEQPIPAASLDGEQEIYDHTSIAKPRNFTEDVVVEPMPPSPESENILEDMAPLSIAAVSRNADNKLLWNKKFLCVFCRKLYAKLPRHFYKDHADELEIGKIMSLKKKSKERERLLDELRNRGVYIRNKNTILEGAGKIEPKRRTAPDSKKDIRGYLPCTHCFQMFVAKYLSRHVRKCPFRPKASVDDLKRNRCIKSTSYLLLPVGPNVSAKFREEILSKMNNDDVFKIIRNDQLILLFGESEFKRLGHDKRYHRTITDRCRELGRLVIKAKQIEPKISKLVQLIDPARYKTFRDAAMQAAGYDEDTGIYKAPSLVLKIGYSIKKCISVLKGEYLEDDILRTEVTKLNTFLQILDSKWGNEVTLHAHRNLTELKWNAPKRIPVTRDIQLIHTYLVQQCETASKMLIQNPEDKCAFKELAEATLVMVIILNRRRVGEVQYMQLSDYVKARSADKDSDIFSTLSESEKVLSQSLVRLIIKGKRGRGVPVLLTKQMQDNIELLNYRRLRCGVDPLNKFLFPSLRNAAGHYRAYNLLNNFAKVAGCEYPGRMLSTQLRKHVATTVQLMNLKENELDSLAQFMGHDIRVHREYYRLSDETVQLAKISKILVNMEKGNIEQMRGKGVEDITVEDETIDFDVEDEDEPNAATNQSVDMPQQQQEQGKHNRNNRRTHKDKAPATVKNKKEKVAKTKSKVIKKSWSTEDARVTMGSFQNYLSMKRLPGKAEIEVFLKKNPQIHRTWRNIKDFLYNKIRS